MRREGKGRRRKGREGEGREGKGREGMEVLAMVTDPAFAKR